jgi:beta-N-acetylhexosaminidase
MKVGQVVMLGIGGTTLAAEEAQFISAHDIGGVILFARNYQSPGQVAQLINEIQKLRQEYPLFIAVDQEGGRVARFKEGFTVLPPMHDLALLKSPKLCFQGYQIVAQELKACGVNFNCAPCADVLRPFTTSAIGDRAFSDDAETVAKFVSAAIRGLQTSGIIACVKHFPGHGMAREDSHEELPHLTISKAELAQTDFVPFQRAFKSARVEACMMGHLVVPDIDPQLPCSMSPQAHRILREDLRFSRLILSDDLLMKAITDHYPPGEAAVKILQAGTDVLVYRDLATAAQAVEGIQEALKRQEIKNEVFQDKIKRIKTLKKAYLANYTPIYLPDLKNKINTRQAQVFLEQLLAKITQVKQAAS